MSNNKDLTLERINRSFKALNVSEVDFCVKNSITLPFFFKILSGEAEVKGESLIHLAQSLKVTVEYLKGESNNLIDNEAEIHLSMLNRVIKFESVRYCLEAYNDVLLSFNHYLLWGTPNESYAYSNLELLSTGRVLTSMDAECTVSKEASCITNEDKIIVRFSCVEVNNKILLVVTDRDPANDRRVLDVTYDNKYLTKEYLKYIRNLKTRSGNISIDLSGMIIMGVEAYISTLDRLVDMLNKKGISIVDNYTSIDENILTVSDKMFLDQKVKIGKIAVDWSRDEVNDYFRQINRKV